MTFETLLVNAKTVLEAHGEEYFEHMLSASQIETWRDCKKKWAYRYIDQVKTPSNAYAAVGKTMHDVAENYLKTGVLPAADVVLVTTQDPKDPDAPPREWTGDDITKIFMAGVKHLPKPGQASIEGYFELETMVGTIRGYKDYVFGATVGDHKTTGDLRWAKTPKDLEGDTQAIIYAADEIDKHDHDVVTLAWTYYQRTPQKPRAKHVTTKISCQSIDKQLLPILETGLEIQAAWLEGTPAEGHPPSLAACDKYGGCPHRGKECKLSNQEKLKGHFKQMGLKEKMLARNAAKKTEAKPETKKEKPAKVTAAAVNPPATKKKAAPKAPAKGESATLGVDAKGVYTATFTFDTVAQLQAFHDKVSA